jgi:hypothetical protein
MADFTPRSFWGHYIKGAWVLFAAAVFFLLGMLGGFAAALSAAFTGALFWWVLIERPSKPTFSRGACFGFFAQLMAYPVIYLVSGFLGLPAGFGNLPAFTYSGSIPRGAEVISILEGMGLWVGIHSLGIIITGPIGVAAGLVLVAVRQMFTSE